MTKSIFSAMVPSSKELARALPDSKGGEESKQLLTYRTEAYSYFVQPGSNALLYSAENWVRIKLVLNTAGPVAVGSRAQLNPTLSGKGILLVTGQTYEIALAKGTRIYITSDAIERVSVTIEPIPWLEQIDSDTKGIVAAVKAAAERIANAVSSKKSSEPAGKPSCPPALKGY